METDDFKRELEVAIRAKVPVIAIITTDEKRSSDLVSEVCKQGERQTGTWKITDEKMRGIKACIEDCSRWENYKHILIVYDLCDLIKSDTSVKRAVIDGIPGIMSNGCVIITFTETNPGMSMIYTLTHNAGLSEQEAIHSFDEAIEGLTRQKDYIIARSTDEPNMARQLIGFTEKFDHIIEQYSAEKDKISKLLAGGKLNRYQVETIIAKCIVRGDISVTAVEKEFKFL